LDKQPDAEFRKFGVKYLMDMIKKDLEDFGVHFDIWSLSINHCQSQAIENRLLAD
jgi:arginyl-tRNA synthetase